MSDGRSGGVVATSNLPKADAGRIAAASGRYAS